MLCDGFHVHHMDGDKNNDDPGNLILIEGADHMRLHGMTGFRPLKFVARKDMKLKAKKKPKAAAAPARPHIQPKQDTPYLEGFPMPKVWNRKDAGVPVDAVYCGRPGPWGNPFVIGRHGTRDQVCDRFKREVLPGLDVSPLKGKDLVCFCAPLRCHCDAILRKANPEQVKPREVPASYYLDTFDPKALA